MQDKSINNALLALHKVGGEQGELAGRILTLRGVTPVQKRYRISTAFKRGELRVVVLEALRDGPLRTREVAAHVQRYKPDWALADTQVRVFDALRRMAKTGMIRREGKLWASEGAEK